jgi:hypothetical protein
MTENKIDFVCHEYIGMEVWRTGHPGKLLTNKDDLKPGDKISTLGLFGEEREMTVKTDGEGVYAEDEVNMMAVLQFDQDDRHCWVSTGFINKKALEKLTLRRGDGDHELP